MEGPIFWIMALIAAALVGAGKGGLPVVGMLGVPVLALVINPVAAAGLLLPVFVVADIFGLWAYRGEFNRRVVGIVAVGATIGVGIGWATASITPEWAVTLLVGLIGLIFGLRLWFQSATHAPRSATVGPGIFWGTITGFTSFVSHSGGPPYQVYVLPLGLSKMVYAGTTTILFSYVNAIKLVPYWALGQIDLSSLKLAALLMPVAALAVFAGVKLVRILPEKLFFRLVTAALVLVSVKLIVDGLAGAWA